LLANNRFLLVNVAGDKDLACVGVIGLTPFAHREKLYKRTNQSHTSPLIDTYGYGKTRNVIP
jgi:hypothetical protein